MLPNGKSLNHASDRQVQASARVVNLTYVRDALLSALMALKSKAMSVARCHKPNMARPRLGTRDPYEYELETLERKR
jgi:hypothetical protein